MTTIMKHIRIATVACAAAVFCGCSAFSSFTEKGKKQPETKTEKVVEASPKTVVDLSKVLNGEWTIESVGSTRIERDEDMPYIYFDVPELSFYASNGCNILNGVFVLDGDRVTFSNILTTMRYCADVQFDTEINAVIADGRTVKLRYDRIASDGVIVVEDGNGRQLMMLRHHAMAFLNGNWQVVEINGQPVDNDEMTIYIDIPEGVIHGNTGCNYFNGQIRIEPGQTNAISFSRMGVTQRMCHNADAERLMLVALEECAMAIDGGDGTALLSDHSGRSNIKIKKIANVEE